MLEDEFIEDEPMKEKVQETKDQNAMEEREGDDVAEIEIT